MDKTFYKSDRDINTIRAWLRSCGLEITNNKAGQLWKSKDGRKEGTIQHHAGEWHGSIYVTAVR